MLDATKVISGTYGQVFLGDDEVAEMKAFQAKLEFQKEEIKVAGQMAVDTKLMSYSGKGSLQLHKVNSRMVKTLLDEIKAGKDKLKGWFVGQIMKASQGKVNPGLANKLLDKKLGEI